LPDIKKQLNKNSNVAKVFTGAKEMGQSWTWIFFMIKGDLRMEIKAVFEPTEKGGFTVYVPLFPGFVSEGDTF